MAETISAIQPLKSDPDRCSVRVGRRRVATLSGKAVRELGLRVGLEWDEALAGRVAEVERFDAARRDALKLVNRRMYSRGELRDKLRRKGHDEAPIDATLDRLEQAGLIDDERYGRAVIDQELRRKPAGPALLRHKLIRKRLDGELIERLVAEASEHADPVDDARRLAEKRLAAPSMRRVDARTRYRRVHGALARRGFDADTIRRALADLPELTGDEAAEF